MTTLDLVVVGAGPAGLAVSAAAKSAGLAHVVLDRGAIAETITTFPENMTFFSTAENLEIGGVPLVTAGEKPTKRLALQYYRRVVETLDLPVRTFTEIEAIEGAHPDFRIRVREIHREPETLAARAIVVATGAHDEPRRLGVPGEELPHVVHGWDDPWRAFGRPVLVVGGRNTAVQACLELWRAGADVTLSYRRDAFTKSVKYWLRPDLENRIAEGSIRAYMPSEVTEIRPGAATIRTPDGAEHEIPADFVWLGLGWRADWSFVTNLGVELGDDGCPIHDEATRETPVPGLYLAGRICAGEAANRIFIENGRHHGAAIVAALNRQ